MLDRTTAIRRLTNRYTEICERFPRVKPMPLDIYIRVNLAAVMRRELLDSYDYVDLATDLASRDALRHALGF